MHGWAYRDALSIYHGLRRLKNRVVNLIDPPVVVLIYHRVTVLQTDPHLLAVSPENFRAQMQFLKRSVRVVRFEEVWPGMRERAVAVTFDDGYADNALEALPVLEEVGVPATFFVSTGALGTREEFWWDELERIILGDAGYPDKFCLDDRDYGRIWSTATRDQRLALHGDINLLKQAMMLDPLTGAVLYPDEISQMTDEMLVSCEQYLPQYKEAIAQAKVRLATTYVEPQKEYSEKTHKHVKSIEEIRADTEGQKVYFRSAHRN